MVDESDKVVEVNSRKEMEKTKKVLRRIGRTKVVNGKKGERRNKRERKKNRTGARFRCVKR